MATNDTYGFGSGSLWTTQLTDYTGAAITLPSPILIGTMQDPFDRIDQRAGRQIRLGQNSGSTVQQ